MLERPRSPHSTLLERLRSPHSIALSFSRRLFIFERLGTSGSWQQVPSLRV